MDFDKDSGVDISLMVEPCDQMAGSIFGQTQLRKFSQ